MLFKFPKKEIVLDCFTNNELALQTAPVTHAIKHMPDWWKTLPNSYVDEGNFFPSPTMKNCVGMINYYKNSVAIPLWSELAIKINADQSYSWQFADMASGAVAHSSKQSNNFLENYGHLKLESPWQFKTKQDVKWVWSQPTYSFNKDIVGIKVLPGVVDYYNQVSTNINLMLPLSRDSLFFLPQGQVLVHITPMFDKKVKIVRHLVSDEEFKKTTALYSPITFINKFRKINNRREQFKDCPYHKG